MGRNRQNEDYEPEFIPASTPEGRENQMIALAESLAEQRLRDGTASNQIIVHYLKLGSIKERKELEVMEVQKALLLEKAEQIKSQKRTEELYAEALNAMRRYSGNGSDDGTNVL